MQSLRWTAALLVALAGCPADEPPPACFTVDTACAPLYLTPSFTPVYDKTITRSCGSDKASCHADGGDAHLSFATEQQAYDGLLDGYVTPMDPSCSEFIVRTSSPGHDYSMPKDSSPLIETERCALVQWVQGGAPR